MIERIFEALGSLGGPWSYLAVSALAAGESSLGVGLVVPGETGMIVGGFIVTQGNADFRVMLAVAIVGAVVGDSIGYEIGRRFGPAIRRTRLGRAIGDDRWQRAEEYVAQRGGHAVFFGRFVAVVRSLVPAVAGITRMPYRRFIAWNALGGALWASIYVTIGYFAGRSYEQVADHAEGAGYVVLGLVAVIVTVVLLARWVAANPQRVQQAADRLSAWGPVAWVQRNFGGPMRFVGRRFHPERAFGLSLTLGLTFLVVATWAFSVLVADVSNRTDLVEVDGPVVEYLAEHRASGLTSAMHRVSDLGDSRVAAALVGVIGVGWVWRTRRWGVLLFFALALGGAMVLTDVLKDLIDRPRPPVWWRAHGVEADGLSFPSGHATLATAVYGALAYIHGSVLRAWPKRVLVWASAVTVVIAVGFSRIYLGAHWLTDVLGGVALGAIWLGIVVTAFSTSTRLVRERFGAAGRRRGSEGEHGRGEDPYDRLGSRSGGYA